MDEFDDELKPVNGASAEAVEAMGAELRRLRGEMRDTQREAQSLAGSISGSLRNAFDRMVTGGTRASDVMRQLGRDLTTRTFDAAIAPLHGALTQGLTGLIGSVLGGVAGSATAFAQGGVLSAGNPQAFAHGGVVGGPTFFGMRGGGLGLMGEAGAEAIMPLKRGPDGRLGVSTDGAPRRAMNVTVNISTPDVAGFQRSRAQVAAQVAKAASLGRRHQ